MSSVRYTKRTEHRGFAHGTAFDDSPSEENSRISKIIVMHGAEVDNLQVYYTPGNKSPGKHGGGGGGKSELVLGVDEYVTAVTGSIRSNVIAHLTFITNKRTWGPLGHPGNQTFSWSGAQDAPKHLSDRIALLSFSGNSTHMLTGLQATFSELPRGHEPSTILKYEGISEATPANVSLFAFHLMSPTICLVVGPQSTQFYANENLLCQIPFFQAALKGKFKEGQEKKIVMPEDSPTVIAALVEFLYTGKYTYRFDLKHAKLRDSSLGVPFGSLPEGLFHVGVCVAAKKYDCPILIREAWHSFQAVLRDLVAIDRFRLWKVAYREGLQFPDWEGNSEPRGTEKEMRVWVKGLFKDHRKEIETAIREDPQFGCDLLRLATG